MSTDEVAQPLIEPLLLEGEQDLGTLQESFAEFVNILPMGLLEIDLRTQKVRVLNRVAKIILGYEPEEQVGELDPLEITTPEAYAELIALTMQFIQDGMQPDGTYRRTGRQDIHETVGKRRDGTLFPVEYQSMFVLNNAGVPIAGRMLVRDVSERKAQEAERERLLAELQEALANVRTLSGLLPICAWCKKVRDDKGYWSEIEAFVHAHSEARFSHGICPDCAVDYEKAVEDRRAGSGDTRDDGRLA